MARPETSSPMPKHGLSEGLKSGVLILLVLLSLFLSILLWRLPAASVPTATPYRVPGMDVLSQPQRLVQPLYLVAHAAGRDGWLPGVEATGDGSGTLWQHTRMLVRAALKTNDNALDDGRLQALEGEPLRTLRQGTSVEVRLPQGLSAAAARWLLTGEEGAPPRNLLAPQDEVGNLLVGITEAAHDQPAKAEGQAGVGRRLVVAFRRADGWQASELPLSASVAGDAEAWAGEVARQAASAPAALQPSAPDGVTLRGDVWVVTAAAAAGVTVQALPLDQNALARATFADMSVVRTAELTNGGQLWTDGEQTLRLQPGGSFTLLRPNVSRGVGNRAVTTLFEDAARWVGDMGGWPPSSALLFATRGAGGEPAFAYTVWAGGLPLLISTTQVTSVAPDGHDRAEVARAPIEAVFAPSGALQELDWRVGVTTEAADDVALPSLEMAWKAWQQEGFLENGEVVTELILVQLLRPGELTAAPAWLCVLAGGKMLVYG